MVYTATFEHQQCQGSHLGPTAAQCNEVQPPGQSQPCGLNTGSSGQVADIVLCLLALDTEEREARRWLIRFFLSYLGHLDTNEHSYKRVSG